MKNWMIAAVFALCLAATPAMAQDCVNGQCRITPVRDVVAATAHVVVAPIHAVQDVVCAAKARRACCAASTQQVCRQRPLARLKARIRSRRCCR